MKRSMSSRSTRSSKRLKLAENLLNISSDVKRTARLLASEEEQESDREDVAASQVIKKARVLQKKKRLTSKEPLKPQKSDIVSISICKMKRSPVTGLFVRDGTFVECQMRRSHLYSDVAENGAGILRLKTKSGALALFNGRGGLIPDKNVIIDDGAEVVWTLGGYLRARHISPEQARLGVGIIDKHQASEATQSSDSDGTSAADVQVVGVESASQKAATSDPRKSPLINQSSAVHVKEGSPASVEVLYSQDVDCLSIVADESHSRRGVWQYLQENASSPPPVGKVMDEAEVFYPERHGFAVSRIAASGSAFAYLRPRLGLELTGEFIVAGYSGKTGFTVAHQSPRIVPVRDLKDLVPIFAIASQHSLCTEYQWFCVDKETTGFPSTPVIYPDTPGVYGCRIVHENKKTEASFIEVKLLPDVPGTSSCSKEEMAIPRPCGMQFTFEELQSATLYPADTNKIGCGGYGSVYAGIVQQVKVAVKFLSQEGQKAILGDLSAKQLNAELAALGRFRHPNVVPLMGYCLDPPALMFEYMERGSLYDNLHGTTQPLPWKERSKVLLDTIRGLSYLHSANPPLVHQDIKTQNILIDIYGNGRIGDFGFSLELPEIVEGRSMFTAQAFARTEGYYPSELSAGYFSTKSDVYCYGVVVLETYTGKKAFSAEREDKKLVDHFDEERSDEAKFSSIQDERISQCSEELWKLLFQVVRSCLLPHSKRPTSMKVLSLWPLVKWP